MNSLDQMSANRPQAPKPATPSFNTPHQQYAAPPQPPPPSSGFRSQPTPPPPPPSIHHVSYLPHGGAAASSPSFQPVSYQPTVASNKTLPPQQQQQQSAAPFVPVYQQPQQPQQLPQPRGSSVTPENVTRPSMKRSDEQQPRANQSYSFRMLNKWIQDSEAVKLTSKKDEENKEAENDKIAATVQKSEGSISSLSLSLSLTHYFVFSFNYSSVNVHISDQSDRGGRATISSSCDGLSSRHSVAAVLRQRPLRFVAAP